jgi:hypothetical protein
MPACLMVEVETFATFQRHVMYMYTTETSKGIWAAKHPFSNAGLPVTVQF